MVRYVHDVTAFDDPLGAVLARLTPANGLNLAYRRPYHGWGMKDGSIVVHSDHAVATAAIFHKHNLVTVRGIRDDDTEFWCGEWLMEEGDFEALSTKGKSGRLLKFTGPNSIYILQRARLLNNIYAPGQPHRGSIDVPGQWTWLAEEPAGWAGARLVRGIEEGQNQPGTPLEHVSIDFTRTHDSNGVPWAQEMDQVQLPVGTTSVLDLALYAIKTGIIVQPSEGLTFSAYQTFGEDKTGLAFGADVVRFTPANVINDIKRDIRASVERSHVLVEGLESTFEEVGGGSSPVGYWDYKRIESDTAATLIDAGERDLAQRELESDAAFPVRHAIVDDPTIGKYVAFDHVQPGWLVSLHTGTGDHDFNEKAIEVAAIRLTHNDAGRHFADFELGAQYLSAESRAWEERANAIVRDARAHSHPEMLCRLATDVGVASCALARDAMTEVATVNGDGEDDTNPGTRWTGDGTVTFIDDDGSGTNAPHEGALFASHFPSGFVNYTWQGVTFEEGVTFSPPVPTSVRSRRYRTRSSSGRPSARRAPRPDVGDRDPPLPGRPARRRAGRASGDRRSDRAGSPGPVSIRARMTPVVPGAGSRLRSGPRHPSKPPGMDPAEFEYVLVPGFAIDSRFHRAIIEAVARAVRDLRVAGFRLDYCLPVSHPVAALYPEASRVRHSHPDCSWTSSVEPDRVFLNVSTTAPIRTVLHELRHVVQFRSPRSLGPVSAYENDAEQWAVRAMTRLGLAELPARLAAAAEPQLR